MSLILLADDSPHALRMGEKILRDEGYDVMSVSDGVAAASRLQELDPELLIVDFELPGMSGFDLCRALKRQGRTTRIILTAGMLESVDEGEATRAGSDSLLRKPFEATAMLQTVQRLAEEVRRERSEPESGASERIRGMIEKAVQAELPRMIEEVTARVLAQLKSN